MHAFWVVLAYDLWDVQYHLKVSWQVLKNWSLILNSQSSILERLWGWKLELSFKMFKLSIKTLKTQYFFQYFWYFFSSQQGNKVKAVL